MPIIHLVLNGVAKFGPAVSVLVAVAGILAALRVAARQRALELKLSLFDKRLAVYREVEEFILCILKKEGSYDVLTDAPRFLDAKERAAFLFPQKSEIAPYLTALYDKAKQLRVLSVKRDHEIKMGVVNENREIFDLLRYFDGPARQERVEVFARHLHVLG